MLNFQQMIDIIRGKNPILIDYIWSMFISDKYLIVPIGTFCLPRVITTVCRLKKRHFCGEKTYPFDLAFFNNIDKNIFYIENRFENFYDGLEYDKNCGYYINKKSDCVFNHERNLTEEEFKNRYDNRIKNFYNDIADENKTIYFVLSSFEELKEEQVTRLIKTIKKYRSDNFKIILLYCNLTSTTKYNDDYVSIIDNIDINGINNDGNWAGELKRRKNKQSRLVYDYLNKSLRKIIK